MPRSRRRSHRPCATARLRARVDRAVAWRRRRRAVRGPSSTPTCDARVRCFGGRSALLSRSREFARPYRQSRSRSMPTAFRLAAHANHLRIRGGHENSRVTYVELFYDLVFVFAVTQLSHGLLEHLTPLGAVQTAVLMLAMWWAWIDTAWITNWLNPERTAVRLMLFALMLAGLVLSASIPKAFGERALPFALSFAVTQVGRSLFMLWALKNHDAGNFLNFIRIVLWQGATASLWIAGALAEGPVRVTLWAIAVGIETSAPLFGFWVPVLGRSATTDWAVEGGHMAERCGLFVIIALGESILVTGATFAGLTWTAEHIGAFLVAFTGSVAMWVIYFNIGAERGSRL